MSPNTPEISLTPLVGAEQIQLLERLSNACAVSGNEGEVRAIVLEEVKPYANDVKVDALGNVLVTHIGKGESPLKVMLDAHMDEVGFMLVEEDKDGLYSFEIVGGIDERQLVGKPVLVGRDHIPGVIGAKPIHHTTREERSHSIPVDSLRIDIGLSGEGKVKPGEWATFATRFTQVGPSLIGKALDDRLGVATLIELLKHAPENITLQLAFTVQEEIGLRGAKVAAFGLNPDLAFAIDSTPAIDLPMWDGSENTQYNTRLDKGPAIYVADGGTLADPRLVRYLAETAEREGIPYQFRQPGGGTTNASAIHRARSGVPSISISISGRYAHTAAGVARVSDWENTLRLMQAALRRLTPAVLTDTER